MTALVAEKHLRVGMVAGEASGDYLGARLLASLPAERRAEGIGGAQMLAHGFHSHYPLAWLSVMGLVEVLAAYPKLWWCNHALRRHFLAHPPDVFIGIDAPDFNLPLEIHLRDHGIPVAHYVSPSVWAWREGRLRTIARACDVMLVLFPFEEQYYRAKGIPVVFTGHPLAEQIPLWPDQAQARRELAESGALGENPPPLDGEWIALLPGSRAGEVARLLGLFLATARQLHQSRPNARFVLPAATDALYHVIRNHQRARSAPGLSGLPVHVLQGHARTAMAAADVVLTASGTASLEAMLMKRPMVVAYRLAALTYWLAKRWVRVPHVALPNLLAGERLVPEFLQHDATPENLSRAVLHWLDHPDEAERLTRDFARLHDTLRGNSDAAAQAVLRLAGRTA